MEKEGIGFSMERFCSDFEEFLQHALGEKIWPKQYVNHIGKTIAKKTLTKVNASFIFVFFSL